MIHQQNKNGDGGIILYNQDDFNGLNLGFSTTAYIKELAKASWQRAINVFRAEKSLCPSHPPVAVTITAGKTVSAVMVSGVVDRSKNNGNAWMIEAKTKIHQLTGVGLSPDLDVDAAFPITISHGGHTTPVGEDIAIIPLTAGAAIVYSFNDTSDGDIGFVNLDATGQDDDWFSTIVTGTHPTLTKTVPHPLIIGDDGYLYIGDGQTLRWVAPDASGGANSTIIPVGYIIKCFSKSDTHLIIYVEKQGVSTSSVASRGECFAHYWNYSATRADYVKTINDNQITSAGNWQGLQFCFTIGSNASYYPITHQSKMHILEAGEYKTIFTFPEVPPVLGGWDIYGNMLHFLAGTTLYSFGEQTTGVKNTVNSIGYIASGVSGMCKCFNGTDLHLSAGSGASLGILKIGTTSPTTFDSNAAWRGVVAEPIFPKGFKGIIDQIEVSFKEAVVSANSLKFTLQIDTDFGDATTTIIDAMTTVSATKKIIYKSLTSAGASLPSFNSLKPIVSYSAGSGTTEAQKVNYIKIYYKLIPIVI
jgi:hypothetical protein